MLSKIQTEIAEAQRKKFYKRMDKSYYLQEARSKGYTDVELFLLDNPDKLAEYEYFNSALIINYPPKSENKEEDIPF